MTRLKHAIIGRNPARTGVRIIILGVFCFLFFGFILRPVRFDGISMEPAYRDGAFRFMSPLVYWFREIERGDVVAIRMPGGGAFYVKRSIGLPGEEIAFRTGILRINGIAKEENYLKTSGTWTFEEMQIPDHHYFVAGDNRATSFSGHALGTVHRRDVAGVVLP